MDDGYFPFGRIDDTFITDEYIAHFSPNYIEVAEDYIRIGTDKFKIIERDILHSGYWIEKTPIAEGEMSRFYKQWHSKKTDDGTLISEGDNPVMLIYGDDAQARWVIAMINALSGYTTEEIEMLETIRKGRDRRLLEATPND